jgi:hypothetical protein
MTIFDIIQMAVTLGCAGSVFWLVKGNPHYREPNTPKGRPSKELALSLWTEGYHRYANSDAQWIAASRGRKYGPWAKAMVLSGYQDNYRNGGSREERFEWTWNKMIQSIEEDEKTIGSESEGAEQSS